MATTVKEKTETKAETIKAASDTLTKGAENKLAKLAASLREDVAEYVASYISTKALVQKIADTLWAARNTFYAPQSSKATARGYAPMGTLLPDLGGRSQGYRDWVAENVGKLISDAIADETEAERVRGNLVRYAIQEKVKAEAKASKDVHATLVALSLETEKQSDRQKGNAADKDARNRANNGANGIVNETLVSEATLYGGKVQDNGETLVPVSDVVAAWLQLSTAMHERITAEVADKLALGDAKRIAQMIENGRQMIETAEGFVLTRIGSQSVKAA